MFELGSALETGYSAHVIVSRAYSPVKDSLEAIASTNSTDSNTATSVIIGDILRGKIAGSQQISRNASAAISVLQTFDNAVYTISANLTEMAELATEAAKGIYSDIKKSELHVEFEELADQINDLVENTEYNGNKLLSSDGDEVTAFISYDSTINVEPADLSVSISEMDLINDAASALTAVQSAANRTSTYSKYLSSKIELLGKKAALVEYDIIEAMGFETGISNTDLAKEITAEVVSEALANSVIALQTQANVSANTALPLL